MPTLLGVDHIAIAVEDLDQATDLWQQALGARLGPRETVESQGVELQMLYAGETRVELLRPLSPESPVGRFLTKRGPGLHHLALAVPECGDALEQARDAGLRTLSEEPVPGAHGTRVVFLHPGDTGGVLTELVEGGEGPWSSPQQETKA
ncbi:MAG: methylmalonyl-CoA epimerase [Planctomycetota bacterium]|nr:MAG: methylmalonyl-CoA epimerase [Planctomycetota bacterium]